MFKALFILVILFSLGGCTTRNETIKVCTYDIEKALLNCVNQSCSSDFQKAMLLYSCIESKGYVFDNDRAERVYRLGKSQGLVSQYKDSKNWHWSWYGLLDDKPVTSTPNQPKD